MRRLLPLAAVFLLLAPVAQGTEPQTTGGFDSWRAAFRAEAAAQGIRADTLQALDGLTPDESVIEQDQSQPEHKATFARYRKNILSAARIKKGRQLYAEHKMLLNKFGARYGVPGKYIVALWGIESSFGAVRGRYSVLQSLATLAYEGRRAAFFRGELMAALRILQNGAASAAALQGSWAGAMGQCQFMPSTYLNHAVDGDGDGSRDIWQNEADVFASMANYLRAEGWKPQMGWGVAVTLRQPLDEGLIGVQAEGKKLTEWQKLGVKLKKGTVLAAPKSRLYYLVQPDGAGGPTYMVTDNYRALMRWNRSTYFATAVGLLADAIAH